MNDSKEEEETNFEIGELQLFSGSLNVLYPPLGVRILVRGELRLHNVLGEALLICAEPGLEELARRVGDARSLVVGFAALFVSQAVLAARTCFVL